MQHAHAEAVRTRVVSDVLRAMDDAGIPRLILKGAALAHLVYRHPLLRPMRDVDVLVRKGDAARAYRLLEARGCSPKGAPVAPDYHHLQGMSQTVDGATVTIEVHHEILRATPFMAPLGYDDLSATAQSFEWAGMTLRTLGREEMLWHTYAHAFAINVLCPGIRLISVADVVHLTETCCDHVDWNRIQRHHGRVFRALPLLHHLTPWSPRVLAKLPADVTKPPSGIRPVTSSFVWSGVLTRDVLWPQEWWFRVRYGIRGRAPWLWYRFAGHPVRLLAAAVDTASRRVAKRRNSVSALNRSLTGVPSR